MPPTLSIGRRPQWPRDVILEASAGERGFDKTWKHWHLQAVGPFQSRVVPATPLSSVRSSARQMNWGDPRWYSRHRCGKMSHFFPLSFVSNDAFLLSSALLGKCHRLVKSVALKGIPSHTELSPCSRGQSSHASCSHVETHPGTPSRGRFYHLQHRIEFFPRQPRVLVVKPRTEK